MKLSCGQCNGLMHYRAHTTSNNGSMDIKFQCSGCDSHIIINAQPHETTKLQELGVGIDDAVAPAKHAEPVKVHSGTMAWDADSLKRLQRIPDFARPMATNAIEKFAQEKGYDKITLVVMNEARSIIGHR